MKFTHCVIYLAHLYFRTVSPYELTLMDESLREFARKKAKEDRRQERLKYRNFSPRRLIARRIEEAKLHLRKEKMNNLGVLQQKVMVKIQCYQLYTV